MAKIIYSIPWNREKNLGVYYNDVCNRLKENEFACFIDGDAMFLHKFYGNQLEDIIAKYPECGLFTCPASRMGCIWQRIEGLQNTDDITYHREIAKMLYATKYDSITDVSNVHRMHVLGGVLILISKKVWRKLGGFKTEGILGVDNDIHWRAMDHNEKVYLMNGVYLYHWYRGGNEEDKGHLL
jgi:GT2 family glycosyltransferase